MKMYALLDTVSGKYYRRVYDGRPVLTVKPMELRSKGEWNAIVVRVPKNWERYGNKGPKPKFKVIEVEVTLP